MYLYIYILYTNNKPTTPYISKNTSSLLHILQIGRIKKFRIQKGFVVAISTRFLVEFKCLLTKSSYRGFQRS